jgi:predicted DNA binding CopG/RHH family protein
MSDRRKKQQPETDAEIAAHYDAQSEEDMLAEFEEARQAGTVRVGGLHVERTVPVTIRMSVSMVEALKAEATRRGVRGYQTLLKQWVEERLSGEPTVSARQVADMLRPLHQLVE